MAEDPLPAATTMEQSMKLKALVPVVVLLIGAGCDLMPAATAAPARPAPH